MYQQNKNKMNKSVRCVECFKGDVQPNDHIGTCDHCGTEFVYTAPNQIVYKNSNLGQQALSKLTAVKAEVDSVIEAKEFKSRGLNRMPSKQMGDLRKKPLMLCTDKNIAMANDWVQVISEDASDTKYGRLMYSPSLDRLRGQTMGEFYGTSIVD